MDEPTTQKIIPADFDECTTFIANHRDERALGLYDVMLEKDWVRELDPSDLLLIVNNCASSRVTIATATNSPDVLTNLTDADAANVREAVADNPKTPVSSLEKLASDSASPVRMAVASNKKTPTSSLETLGRDAINYVRWGVANNERTPPEVLKTLAKDPDQHVRDEARRNPSTPKSSWLARLLGKD